MVTQTRRGEIRTVHLLIESLAIFDFEKIKKPKQVSGAIATTICLIKAGYENISVEYVKSWLEQGLMEEVPNLSADPFKPIFNKHELLAWADNFLFKVKEQESVHRFNTITEIIKKP